MAGPPYHGHPVAVQPASSPAAPDRGTPAAAVPAEPTFADVLAARSRIAGHLLRTPLRRYPALERSLGGPPGTEVWVKHENFQVTGAFKVRGGLNLVGSLGRRGSTPEAGEAVGGVVTASTGNHGQSIAWASRLAGLPATVCVPEAANPVKVEAMLDLGAEVLAGGDDFDEARERAEEIAAERGWRFVSSGDEPDLIAGVATATLEVLEDLPEADVLVVPVGGGSGAAAAGLVASVARPALRVVGVQSAAAPAARRSWEAGRLVEDATATFAEGLATRTAFGLPQAMMRRYLADFVLVGDDEIRAATAELITASRSLVEPAAAAPLAAVRRLGRQLAGGRVVLMVTGANVSPEQLRAVLG